jgi:hypothetical protein
MYSQDRNPDKKGRLKMFFKVINKEHYLKKGFKRLSGLYAALKIRELVNWWSRILMSQTGY